MLAIIFWKVALGNQLCEFLGCLEFIDRTLVEIRKAWKDLEHRTWFNGRKKIYAMENKPPWIVYLYWFRHPVSILCHLTIYWKWCQYFTHRNDYIEYFLGDLGYLGEKMFITRKMGRQELPPNVDHGAIHAYNKMRAEFRVQMEWGIGGLKQNLKCFIKKGHKTKKFPSFRNQCSHHQLPSLSLDGLHIWGH
jgi:hypothetical protein